jgi:hypothetical protein
MDGCPIALRLEDGTIVATPYSFNYAMVPAS